MSGPRRRPAARPASSSSGVRSVATTCAPARAAGIAALPLPAATSSTRSPVRRRRPRRGPGRGRDHLVGHGAVVAQRPHGAVLALERPVGLVPVVDASCHVALLVRRSRRPGSDARKIERTAPVQDLYWRAPPGAPRLRAMGAPYHQFCPVAKAMELLDERWTLLVVRELLLGSRRFNDLRRGVPRMSPTLLSKRLRELAARRRRRAADRGRRGRLRAHPGRPRSCARSSRRSARGGPAGSAELGRSRTSTRSSCSGTCTATSIWSAMPARPHRRPLPVPGRAGRGRTWWLVARPGARPTCATRTPATTWTSRSRCRLRRMVEIWLGDASWTAALRAGDLHLEGPSELCRALPRWFTLSPFAAVPRPRPAKRIAAPTR